MRGGAEELPRNECKETLSLEIVKDRDAETLMIALAMGVPVPTLSDLHDDQILSVAVPRTPEPGHGDKVLSVAEPRAHYRRRRRLAE